jgi:hypothetical protein
MSRRKHAVTNVTRQALTARNRSKPLLSAKLLGSMLRMPGRRLTYLFAAGAGALFLISGPAGCGAGDEATSSEPLTRAQFVKRANAICLSEEERKTKAFESASKLGKKFFAGSKKELTQLISTVGLPLYEEIIEELAALKPPSKEQAKWDAIIRHYEETLKEAEAHPAKQLVNDSFSLVDRAATKFGVKNCTL